MVQLCDREEEYPHGGGTTPRRRASEQKPGCVCMSVSVCLYKFHKTILELWVEFYEGH